MGKASRQRRLNKEKERQRQRAARGAPSRGPGLGYQPGRRQVPSQQDLVNSLIGEAVYALCGGSQEAYRGHVQQLANERAPGWTQAVSRSLVESLRLSVTAAWRHGWQPAELARHVGRELSDTHAAMAADMITDEMRGYAAATVDARWAAQVAALDATPAAGRRSGKRGLVGERRRVPGCLAGTGGRCRTARGGRDRDRDAARVPASRGPRTAALAAGNRPAGRAACRPDRSRRRAAAGRIRALLAKAESTEFAEEAEALSARAQELMAKYSIDHALLAAETGRTEEPGGRRIAVDNPYEAPKASLLQTVAQANRCRVVWSKELGLVTVIGFPADLDAVELLFTSLLVQANTAMLRAGAKQDAYGRSRTRAFRQSFLVSYAIRIGERLSEATGHAEQQAAAEQAAASEVARRHGPGAVPGGTSPGRR